MAAIHCDRGHCACRRDFCTRPAQKTAATRGRRVARGGSVFSDQERGVPDDPALSGERRNDSVGVASECPRRVWGCKKWSSRVRVSKVSKHNTPRPKEGAACKIVWCYALCPPASSSLAWLGGSRWLRVAKVPPPRPRRLLRRTLRRCAPS